MAEGPLWVQEWEDFLASMLVAVPELTLRSARQACWLHVAASPWQPVPGRAGSALPTVLKHAPSQRPTVFVSLRARNRIVTEEGIDSLRVFGRLAWGQGVRAGCPRCLNDVTGRMMHSCSAP